jgi:pimeloyl-[acyl-carrier protein] synthase
MNAPDLDFSRIDKLGNRLFDRVRELREFDPIFWSESQQTWIVTGHEQVLEGFRGDLPLSCKRMHFCYAHLSKDECDRHIPYTVKTLESWIINSDPPDQPRLRKLMMKAFSRKVAEDMRPFARQVVAETLDRAGRKGDVEFMEEVARAIPPRVLVRLMGLPDEYAPRAYGWAQAVDVALGSFANPIPKMEIGERALLDMREFMQAEIASRRQQPRDDFLSALISANEEGEQLSEEEMIGICHLILVAGHSTTANTIGLSVAALADHPEARDYIRAHPEKAVDTAMELSRYVAMSSNQVRVVAEDFDWRGHAMKKGQFVQLMISGANRDPKVFPDPDALDFSRRQDMNMSFAPGLHFCIGHWLAKVQLTEFFAELLRRFDPEVLDPELVFQPPSNFRALDYLHVRLHPRAVA